MSWGGLGPGPLGVMKREQRVTEERGERGGMGNSDTMGSGVGTHSGAVGQRGVGSEPDTAILLAAGRKHYLLGEKMKGIMRDESEIEQ